MLFRTAVACFTLLTLTGCEETAVSETGKTTSLPRAAWVWNRSTPFQKEEQTQLIEAGIQTIFWQIGELKLEDGKLAVIGQWPLPESTDKIEFHPVVRLDSSIQDPSEVDPVELASRVKAAGATGSIQFDFDCPTRLLPRYAKLLTEFRQAYGEIDLSCTALLSWTDSSDFAELEEAVDSIYPMFYDALPETPQSGNRPSNALPLIEFSTFSAQLRKWEAGVSIPWHLGLPNFRRLSIFRNGKPQGHIRSWTKEELMENPAIRFDSNGRIGTFIFQVTSPTRIGTVSLQKDDWLCFRQCDREALAQSLEAGEQSSAESIVWYQLPREGLASNGWSVPELAGNFHEYGFKGKAEIRENRLHLSNPGPVDIPLNPGELHKVIISSDRPFLRELEPGEFSKAVFVRNEKPVPAFAATEVSLYFHHLHAGESLASGLFLIREPPNSLQINYSLDHGQRHKLEIVP